MAANQEPATGTTSLQVPRVKLSWSVSNWRSSQEYAESLSNDKMVYYLYGPELKTEAGSWQLILRFDIDKNSRGKVTSRYIETCMKKLDTDGIPMEVQVRGFLKTLDKSSLWGLRMNFDQRILKGSFIVQKLGDIDKIPDSLRISAEFDVFGLKPTSHQRPTAAKASCDASGGPSQISIDFGSLLEDKDFSDVTVKVEGQSFGAHRAILASRSAVLGAMLRSDMSEKEEGVISLEDTSAAAWSLFQRFLYTGVLGADDKYELELLSELLLMSDKYDVASLLSHLEEVLLQKLTEENALEIYKLVNLFEVPTVKQEAVEILLRNWADIDDARKKEIFEIPALSETMFLRMKM